MRAVGIGFSMEIRGTLERRTKETVALAVSATNNYGDSIDAHTAALCGTGTHDAPLLEIMAVADLYSRSLQWKKQGMEQVSRWAED
ncbi:MAG: carboxymuconolactone decarboxylase family protein [Nitrospiria bacterium]